MTFMSGPMVTPPPLVLSTITDEEIDRMIEIELRDTLIRLGLDDHATRTVVFSLDLTDKVLMTRGVLTKTDELLDVLAVAYHETRTHRYMGHLEMTVWAPVDQLREHLRLMSRRAREVR